MKTDILKRLAESSNRESSHELQCRCFDAAEEISRMRCERETMQEAISAQAKRITELSQIAHYPECWDETAYPDLESALYQVFVCDEHGKLRIDENADTIAKQVNRIDSLTIELNIARERSRGITRLEDAIKTTLDENGHLADGDNCTLIILKRALRYEEILCP